jgi:hypothetical protein
MYAKDEDECNTRNIEEANETFDEVTEEEKEEYELDLGDADIY